MATKPSLKFVSALSPLPGNLYTETLFYQPKRTISGNNASALILKAFPYGFGTFNLTWSEFVSDVDTAKKLKESGKYNSYREFSNSKVIIGYRTEWVPFFKEVETHPFVVESNSAVDGVSTEIVITIVTKIKIPSDGGPLKILALKNPLEYVFGFINEAILRWANQKSSKDIRRLNPDDNPNATTQNPLDEIQIGGEFYLDYLNKKEFEKYEIEVSNVNLRLVALAANSVKVAEAEQGVVIAESKAKEAEHKKNERIELNKATDEENKTALSFYQGKLKANTDFITSSAESLKKINEGYAKGTQLRTLFVGQGSDEILNKMIAAAELTKNTQSKKGGQND